MQPGLHRERADDRDALLLSAREPVRVLVALVGEAETGEELVGASLGLRPGEPERLPRRERDVVEDGHVREEIERLEDDPDPAAQLVHVDSACRDVLTAHDDASRVDRLEQVDAAQERGLPGAGSADEAYDLVLGEAQVDASEDFELVEGLVQTLDVESVTVAAAHASLPACWRRLSRAISQSVRRAIGTVSAMKMSAVAMYGV